MTLRKKRRTRSFLYAIWAGIINHEVMMKELPITDRQEKTMVVMKVMDVLDVHNAV